MQIPSLGKTGLKVASFFSHYDPEQVERLTSMVRKF